MKTRNQIEKLIKSKQRKINSLSDEIDLLKIEALQICDSEQTYEEKEEEFIVKKRPLTKETHMIGRIHWLEDFIDEDDDFNDDLVFVTGLMDGKPAIQNLGTKEIILVELNSKRWYDYSEESQL